MAFEWFAAWDCRVQGLGLRVLEFRVSGFQGLRFRDVQGLRFRDVQGLASRAYFLGCRMKGLAARI